ncbi:MAG: DUF6273 domain-containing protein [Micrococcales bacterium]|nr:DUF6273 domain-containing protein [Micrococcales bacterium]
MDGSSGQDAVIARLEAKVAELEATVARLGGADQVDGAVPPWGTPSMDRPVGDADQVADAVDGSAHPWGTPEPHGRDGAPGPHTDHDDTTSTAEQVDEVCRHIASGTWTAHSPPVWLSGRAWQVLDVADGRAFLLADQVVCKRPYHQMRTAITWQHCDLRRWLNKEFLPSLGGPLVSRVLTVRVPNEPNPVWGTRGGNSTKDRVFLLSMQEAAALLNGKEPDTWDWARYLTLGNRGKAEDEKGGSVWWWLRSPGGDPDRAVRVTRDGTLREYGRGVSWPAGVRPVFWLSLQPKAQVSSGDRT